MSKGKVKNFIKEHEREIKGVADAAIFLGVVASSYYLGVKIRDMQLDNCLIDSAARGIPIKVPVKGGEYVISTVFNATTK